MFCSAERLFRTAVWTVVVCLAGASLRAGQDADSDTAKQRATRIRELGKRKADAIPALTDYLTNRDRDTRVEAVKAITRIGGDASLAPLIKATHDNDAEVQTRAVDGLVNRYVPGYVARGLTGPITRGVRQAKAVVFTRNDQIIESGVMVPQDVQEAIRDVVAGGSSVDARVAAARAAGILRDKAAVPALAGSLRAHDSGFIFESLVALQKIRERSELPSLGSAAHDLDERTQITALETIGILHSVPSATDVRSTLKTARNIRVERAALEALAMLGQAEDRTLFQQYAASTDAQLRSAALEGLGRVREPEDYPVIEKAYNEPNVDWRVHLAAAFALVNQGKVDTSDYSPLPYLVENIAMKSRVSVASAYLAEVCRRGDVRSALTPLIGHTTRDGKLALCSVLGESGSSDTEPVLQNLTRDVDADVATAAAKALRTIKARQTP